MNAKSEPSKGTTIKSNGSQTINRIKPAFVLGASCNYIHEKTEVTFDSLSNARAFVSADGLLGIKFGRKRQRSVFGIYGSTALFTSSDSVLFDKSEYEQKYATQMEYGLGYIHRGWLGIMLGYGHSGRSAAFMELPDYYTCANIS